jgi:hypothetical protein
MRPPATPSRTLPVPIQTTCPLCGQSYTVADSMADKLVKCKGCDKPFRVSAPAAKVAVADDRDRERDRRDDFDDRPRRRRDDDDEYDRRPPRRRIHKAAWVWAGIGVAVLLIVLVVVIVKLAGGSSAGPVNADNYDRIKYHDPEETVRQIMGPPSDTEAPNALNRFNGFGTVLVWKNGTDYIRVFIVGGRVEGKSSKLGIVSKHQQGL